MTKEALIAEGYEVVSAKFTKEDYAEGRNLVAVQAATGGAPGSMRDFWKNGETLTLNVWSTFFLLRRSVFT